MPNKKKYGEEPRPYVPAVHFRHPKPIPSAPIEPEIPLTPGVEPTDPAEPDLTPPTLLDTLHPPTLSYLSALPIHLHPVSPYLAALHDARIRLVSIQLRSPIRWCINCGSLRDTSLDSTVASSTSSTSPTKKSPNKKAKTAAPVAPCPTCGEKFRRVAKVAAKDKASTEVLASFKPARAVRRSRRDAGVPDVTPSEDVEMGPAGGEGSGSVLAGKVLPWPTLHTEDDAMGTQLEAAIPTPDPPASIQIPPTAQSATPLAAPNLRYIPNTAPTPPTYDQPRSVRPPSATAIIGGKTVPVTSAGKAEEGGAKRKKKKASGLAKLLAQSKEREEGEMGGKWGFG